MSKSQINANSAHLPDGTWSIGFANHESYDEFFIEYEHSRICPHCHGSNCISKGSAYVQTVRHVPLANRQRLLTFKKRRYFCKDCGVSFYEQPGWLHHSLHMTAELYFDIYFKLTELIPQKTIATLCCVPESVIRDVLDSISFERPSHLPQTLCIDEFKGDSGDYMPAKKRWHHDRYQCSIVNGDSGSCLDILPDYHVDFLRTYFLKFDDAARRSVKYVCCDMHNGFVTLSRKCFPDAVVCVDIFHVVKDLNKAVDSVRVRLQKASSSAGNPSDAKSLFHLAKALRTKCSNQDSYWHSNKKKKLDALETAFKQYPQLSTAYDALQEFHMINDGCDDIHIRRADLSDWIRKYTVCGVSEVESVAGSIKYWRKNIENSWIYHKSNAPCEGTNKRIKDIKRMANGMQNFESFRKRILLVCGNMHLYHPAAEYAMPVRHTTATTPSH